MGDHVAGVEDEIRKFRNLSQYICDRLEGLNTKNYPMMITQLDRLHKQLVHLYNRVHEELRELARKESN